MRNTVNIPTYICINPNTSVYSISSGETERLDLSRELISLGEAEGRGPILGLQCRQMRRRITSNGLTTRLP